MTKKTTKTRSEAKRLMWEYYRDNREMLPARIRKSRDDILALLCKGENVSVVFASIIETVESNTPACP